MERKSGKIKDKVAKRTENRVNLDISLTPTQKEWNKYKKQFENSLKTNKDE